MLLTQAKEEANNFYIFLKSTFSQAVPTVQLLQTFKLPCYCMQNADSYYIIIPDTQLNSLCLNSQCLPIHNLSHHFKIIFFHLSGSTKLPPQINHLVKHYVPARIKRLFPLKSWDTCPRASSYGTLFF